MRFIMDGQKSPITRILEEESKILMDLTLHLTDKLSEKYVFLEESKNLDIKRIHEESDKKFFEYEEKFINVTKDIQTKDNLILKMEKEINSLKNELSHNQLSLTQTKDALALCQSELRSTSTDLEKYFRVSEIDRKNIHSAYLEMRDKAVQESLKRDKFETECSLLKSGKENCELELMKNQKKLQKTLQELRTSKSSFEKNIINKEAQNHQIQFLNSLKQIR